ncbi:AAA family ATPase [Acidithiobacillus thiooxidans]|uniref:AAA family ATPase n=1 Tax=Acidithiobacillus thiooxidans TaxID=930 RepID=UPI001C072B5A|nr:AAA family ATPase [Acidithiobacillus thiooxidans]MBU2835039.1 AAA family ATPase [Acidithiobacillus thiooxidans]MBU2839059.1 AAA family ATPase [Acidithiobacillus thiooxidans]MBU2844215.1 AAA family ATPase [Acidithiobacillus thiooxidans]
MTLPKGMVQAIYKDTGISQYQGNPLIEALPPILDRRQLKEGLSGQIAFRPTDIYLDGPTRIHVISQLLDNFFQPLSRHIELESKLSVMLRQGYVGRNLATGELNAHIQNGYERVMQGDLAVFRFEHVESTAKSLAFIGCSGSGKTSSLNRILATYPQLIYHETYNFTQIVFLKIDCPHDGSLKSLCHNFFREIDAVLATNYVRRYVEKRHSVETLIAVMAHIANTHAIGLLVIDEIQHLSVKHSGGAERMLNFFVTLVNEISVPVVMVGTPKARSVFELDLRSARRGAGFGAILWEPLSKPSSEQVISRTEWGAFTSRLWKYQWLTKASPDVTDEIRDTWYDLSQGIMDVVIKLFVLSQIRAVVTGVERITQSLMRKVYQDELKPIHPMIDALRSGDVTKIARYSDLTIPDVDRKILELGHLLRSNHERIDTAVKYGGNEQAIRLHNMLVDMGYVSELLEPLINRAFENHPGLVMKDLMPLILSWYQSAEIEKTASSKPKMKTMKRADWHTLDSNDLRFLFSQSANEEAFLESLSREGLLFDAQNWINSFG